MRHSIAIRTAAIVTLTAGLAVAAGCASTIKGTSANVEFASDPPGADLYLEGEYKGKTPQVINVDQSCWNYAVRMEAPGYDPVETALTTGFSGYVFTTLFYSMIVDAITGTYCTVDTERLIVKLAVAGSTPVSPTPPETPTGPGRESGWPDIAAAAAGDKVGAEDVAVVVAIEDYLLVSDIEGATDNGKAWFEWLTRARGIPYDRITLLTDQKATDVEIRAAVAAAAKQAGPSSTVWFVFIGHGAPAKDQKDGILVGVDAQQTVNGLYGRSVPQRELLDLLGKGKQANTVVVLDACFSGKATNGAPLVAGLQPLLPVKSAPKSDAIVMTAGGSDEFAGPLPGGARPAFSYLVLGALRGWGDANGDGAVTADEAITYARDTLRATLSGRQQTPEKRGGKGEAVLSSGAAEAGPDLGAIILKN